MSSDSQESDDSRKRSGSTGTADTKRQRADDSIEIDPQQAQKIACHCCNATFVPSDSHFLFSCERGAPLCAFCFSRSLTQAPSSSHLECPCCSIKCTGWTVQKANKFERFTLPAPDRKLDPVRYHQSLEEPSKHLTISLVSGGFDGGAEIAIPQSMHDCTSRYRRKRTERRATTSLRVCFYVYA
jgi:hypothetical protein